MQAINFSLNGIAHTLKDGDGVGCFDHGGSGPHGFMGIYDESSNTVIEQWSRKFTSQISPEEAIRQACELSGLHPVRIVYGVAAPVKANQCSAGVHMPYAVNGDELSDSLPGHPLVLVQNDYELLLWRFMMPVGWDAQESLQEGLQTERGSYPGVITVIGPGSGLGVGCLTFLPGGNGFLPQPLEGGHGPLVVPYQPGTPDNDLYWGLIPWWTERYGTVNADEVLCASGLLKILRYLVLAQEFDLPERLSHLLDESRDTGTTADEDRQLLTEEGLSRQDLACMTTVKIFMGLLGYFAQTAAFLHGQRNRNYTIYLGGGVGCGLLSHPDSRRDFGPVFLEKFQHTKLTVDRTWLAYIPIRVLRDHREEALYGATIAAACMTVRR